MSENDEDLELAALQRELDDAFATTRPRQGFGDELWLRVQSSRPAPRRLRDALAGLRAGLRAVPLVPTTAIAAVLVVALGLGFFLHETSPGAGGASYLSTGGNAPARGAPSTASFGRLPTPVFTGQKSSSGAQGGQPLEPASAAAAGQVAYTWTGKLDLAITTAPVFRYLEPSAGAADQFATSLGAVLRERPSGFLGSYSASGYTLKVRGTVQSPPSSPAYFIFASSAMPAIEVAGADPAAQADVFLAQHHLTPAWPNTVEVDTSGDPVKVRYERSFEAPGYGPAYIVDPNGQRYGLEVDLSGNRPVVVSGLLPVNFDEADYKVASADNAVAAALATGAPSGQKVELTHAELVYVLVPAGNHSFYEPAILFSGTQTVNGGTVLHRVLVPAVDPSQRTP